MKNNGLCNTIAIAEYLTHKLDGKSVISLDLSNYITIHKAIVPDWFESSSIVFTHMIDSKEVQGIFYPQKVSVAVHRVMYVNQNGYVPGKKQIDHKCWNRMCVNPEHLEMVIHKENQRRRDNV